MNKKVLCFLPFFLVAAINVSARTNDVVVTIKPLHSLVQGVMGNTGEAKLLLKGATPPHGAALRPSQMRLLRNADALFFIDENFEIFLRNTLAALPAKLKAVPIVEATRLRLLDRRDGGAWDDQGHEEHAEQEKNSHPVSDDHDHRYKNLHVWLDTDNARRIIGIVVQELSALYPANKSAYGKNADALFDRLDRLDKKIMHKLSPVKDMPFVVLHDAYPYFERKYGLNGVGSITLEPDAPASIGDLRDVRRKIQMSGAVCIFREPQFDDRLVRIAAEGSAAKTGTLDPLGADLDAGPDLYFKMMSGLADNFAACASN